jgi:glucokinase
MRGGPVLALDLGATRVRAALVGPDGSVLARAEALSRTERGPAAVLDTAEELLRAVRAPAIGIGISAIGPVDPVAGVIVDPPNAHPTFRDVPIASELARRIGLPAFLDRDTNVALLGERAFGVARGVADVVYLTVSTGIGGAILAGGVLLHGADGTAGELGHLLIELDGPPCGCGARGHLEAIACGAGIAREARAAIEAGASPMLRAVADHAGLDGVSAADVAAAEEAGDPAAGAIMSHARRAFAAAMVVIADVFNPSLVVVGGSIARAQGDRLLQPARDAVRATAFRTPGRRLSIVPAALGDDVGLVGCLPLVRERLTAGA